MNTENEFTNWNVEAKLDASMNELQWNEPKAIRFSMTEASFCVLTLDFYLFGRKTSAEFEAFYNAFKSKNTKRKLENHCEFEWVIEFCIKQANKGRK